MRTRVFSSFAAVLRQTASQVAGASCSRPCPERPAPSLPSSAIAKTLLPILSALHLLTLPATALTATWNAATDIPVAAPAYTATGNDITFSLNCVPTSNELTVIKNTGVDFIHGAFTNLTQGQAVDLSYSGTTYHFVANYYGGSGNDLVLVWAGNRAFSWGSNRFGQLGDGTTTQRNFPVAVTQTGVLAGRTVVAVYPGPPTVSPCVPMAHLPHGDTTPPANSATARTPDDWPRWP